MTVSIEHDGMLRVEDDGFHLDSGVDWQTEGSWWCFFDRERRLGGWIYHITRTTLSFASGGVWVWHDGARLFAEVPYFRDVRPQFFDLGDGDLRRFTWPDGVSLEMLEPLQRYRLTYNDAKRISLDLQYEGIMSPYVSAVGDPKRVTRFDQPCRVTGLLRLNGEAIPIDCLAMRDHSWGSRPEPAAPAEPSYAGQGPELASRPAPYLYATASADDAFFVILGRGILVRSDRRTDLVSITQRIERDPDGCPRHVIVDGEDTEGRRLHAEGETLSAILRPSQSRGIGWICVLDWSFDGQRCLGDIQDVWSIPAWREYRAWLKGS